MSFSCPNSSKEPVIDLNMYLQNGNVYMQANKFMHKLISGVFPGYNS